MAIAVVAWNAVVQDVFPAAEHVLDGAETVLQPLLLAVTQVLVVFQRLGFRPDGFRRRRRQRFVRHEHLIVFDHRRRRRQIRTGRTTFHLRQRLLLLLLLAELFLLRRQFRHPVVDRYGRAQDHWSQNGCRQRTATGTERLHRRLLRKCDSFFLQIIFNEYLHKTICTQ